MAEKPAKPKTAKSAPSMDAVNSDQLPPEGELPPEALAGPDVGELEERAADAEARADAAEREKLSMAEELETMKAQIAALMRAQTMQTRIDRSIKEDVGPYAGEGPQPGEPEFDENRPHGIVSGDSPVAYVQDGHQFGRNRAYIATEKFRGAGRPFNPRLVGFTKPRPNQKLVDALEGIRDE